MVYKTADKKPEKKHLNTSNNNLKNKIIYNIISYFIFDLKTIKIMVDS